MRRPASLQGRLLLLLLAAALGVWIATAVVTWRDARHELDELLDGHLAQAAALLVAQHAGEPDDDEVEDVPPLHRYAPRVAFQVFHEGRLVLRSANAPLQPLVQAGRRVNGFHSVEVDGQGWRVFVTRGAKEDMRVLVGESLGARQAILRALLTGTLRPLALALPLLALAVWWAVRRGLRPLRTLGQVLAARRPGDLQPVRLADAPSEMQPMLRALDGLFARIGELLEGERRFTADAAHELRTPIAAIRAQAQAALATRDAGVRAHALERLLEGCDRAARLVQQLLVLSRLEAEGSARRERVALAALVREVVADELSLAPQRTQDLALDADDEATVAGDAVLLQVLARNLVHNALRYSPSGTPVAVLVRKRAGAVELVVEDGGPGLAPQELARLGERFFRPAGAQASGSGLGWSIVRRIAAAHDAQVDVRSTASLGGLQVAVRFPAAAP